MKLGLISLIMFFLTLTLSLLAINAEDDLPSISMTANLNSAVETACLSLY